MCKCFKIYHNIFVFILLKSDGSSEVGCTMKFGVFLPAEALAGTKLPVVVWLSGQDLGLLFSINGTDRIYKV